MILGLFTAVLNNISQSWELKGGMQTLQRSLTDLSFVRNSNNQDTNRPTWSVFNDSSPFTVF